MFGSAIKYINYHTFHGKDSSGNVSPKRFYMCYVLFIRWEILYFSTETLLTSWSVGKNVLSHPRI